MTSQIDSSIRYVYISGIDAHSSVYDLLLDSPVIINDVENIARNIQLGDSVIFKRDQTGTKYINFMVKYVGYSRFPSSCFTPECEILSINGLKPVKDLLVGDMIIAPNGTISRIKCILVTLINSESTMMVHPNGLCITGYHPVKINSKWIFPIDSEEFQEKTMFVESVYSIGLEDNSSMFINGIEVIGLGHKILDDPVASHSFFGTEAVIDNLFELAPSGYCVIRPEQLIRNTKTKLVNKIIKM